MKTFITLSIMSLIATSAFAASPKVLIAVLKSKAIANVQDIQKVEVIETYRCLNCFDIEVSGTNVLGEASVQVRTEQTSSGLKIEYTKGSK